MISHILILKCTGECPVRDRSIVLSDSRVCFCVTESHENSLLTISFYSASITRKQNFLLLCRDTWSLSSLLSFKKIACYSGKIFYTTSNVSKNAYQNVKKKTNVFDTDGRRTVTRTPKSVRRLGREHPFWWEFTNNRSRTTPSESAVILHSQAYWLKWYSSIAYQDDFIERSRRNQIFMISQDEGVLNDDHLLLWALIYSCTI